MRRNGRRPSAAWIRLFLKWPAQAAALWLWWAIVRLLPRRAAIALGATLGEAIGPLLLSRSAKLDENLANAFPDLPPMTRDILVRRIWGNFGRVLADYPYLHTFWGPSNDVVEVAGEQHLEAVRKTGAFLLVGAHFGHWELPAIHVSRKGIKGIAIYAPSNPLIDAQIQRCRRRAGNDGTLVPRQTGAVRQMIAALQRGEAVFLLADHRVENGSLVPFFGQPAMTTLTPARLARRFDCPILLARAEQLPNGRYQITYAPPLRTNMSLPTEEDVLAVTGELMRTFESWIRTAPEQWNYLKRRWPKRGFVA
jgi:Kdo2-lipid IVA lauroyltransferase/acyltransferase